MPVPPFQELLLPLLKLTADGREHKNTLELLDLLANEFKLTPADLAELLPDSDQSRFHNRVNWAKSYLKIAGLLEQPSRGRFRITPFGREVASRKLEHIDVKWLLMNCPAYAEHQERKKNAKNADDESSEAPSGSVDSETPHESIERGHKALRDRLAEELLDKVKSCSPAFFEQLVVDLLVGMGYGGSRKDAATAVGRSGDGGIDGIIKEDRLGLDAVYIQAKRWEGTVGRPVVMTFAGSLDGRRARKGVLITTSEFSKEARQFVENIEKKIVLIDGGELVRHMMECGLGVNTTATYTVHRLDLDYFEEEA